MNPMQRLAQSDPPKRKQWVYRWQPKEGPCPWLIRLARQAWVEGGVEHPGISQRALGMAIGLSGSSPIICWIESYRLPCTAERLANIAKVLECEPEDLCAKSAKEAADNEALYVRWVDAGKPILREWIHMLER